MEKCRPLTWTVVTLVTMVGVGCVSPSGGSETDQRADILNEHERIVREFVAEHSFGQEAIDNSVGYATMTNIQTQVLLVGGGNGYGVAVQTADGSKTFMKSTELSGGPGLGVASYRSLLVFNDPVLFEDFLAGQWLFQAEADATAKAGYAGGGAQATGEFNQPVAIFHMSGSGLQAKANLGGVKFSPDPVLNN
ncbi:MAG: hypothetical protein AAGG38_02505 [Planctomycetota bacterium]